MTCYVYNTCMNDNSGKFQQLDKHSPVPLYYQLMNIIEELINTGTYKPGELIPSENQLCKQYEISRTTVRQAIQELVNSGKLVRTQGRGTFVNTARFEKPTYRLSGFTQDMKELGLVPNSNTLQFAPLMPPRDVSEALKLEENEAAIMLERLRFAGKDVMGVDISYFSFKRFMKLLNMDFENNSLYQTLEKEFGVIPIRSKDYVEARRCPREIADLLEISPGDPVLFLREFVYDQDEIPFELGEAYYRADRNVFRFEIRKNEHESFRTIPTGI
jgi:GntR family transcriptional regulator